MECDDGSEISSRVYSGREDEAVGSPAARGIVESDWAGFRAADGYCAKAKHIG